MMKHKIHHRVFGEKGPIYVLLHGYGGSPKHWAHMIHQLSPKNRVVVLNLGPVYLSTDPLFFTVQVELVLQFIEKHFPSEMVRVVGLSYGGLLAWAMSLQRPELFERVHLLNPLLPSTLDHVQIPELKYMLRVPFHFRTLAFLLSTPVGKIFLRKASVIFSDSPETNFQRIENLQGRKLLFVTQMIRHFSWIIRNEDWGWWLKKAVALKSRAHTEMTVSNDDPLFSLISYQKFETGQNFQKINIIQNAGHLISLTQPNEIVSLLTEGLLTSSEKLPATGS